MLRLASDGIGKVCCKHFQLCQTEFQSVAGKLKTKSLAKNIKAFTLFINGKIMFFITILIRIRAKLGNN
jgi:hypothetical protein